MNTKSDLIESGVYTHMGGFPQEMKLELREGATHEGEMQEKAF